MASDDALKSALLDYVKAICIFLSEKITPDADPKDLLSKYIGNFMFEEHEQYRQYPINWLPEAERYKQEIRNHPIVGRQVDTLVGISTTRTRVTVWTVLLEFMTSLIDKQKGLSFSKRCFNAVFKEMMSFFKSTTIQIQHIVPLENFMSDISSVNLDSSWRLGKFAEEVHALWWHMSSHPMPVGPLSHSLISYGLIKEEYVERFFGTAKIDEDRGPSDLDRLVGEIEIIVSALRLLKEGRVVPRVRTTRAIGWHVGAPERSISWNPNIPATPVPTYTLLEDEVPELVAILNSLKAAESDRSFQVALRRLNYSVERSDVKLEDRILDTMIGLESLFLRERGELSYRLGLRVALFLGKSLKERQDLQEFIVRSYRLRSTIIHGYEYEKIQADLKKLDMGLHEVGKKLETLLRRALRRYLDKIEEGNSRDAILDQLESRILEDASISE